MRIALVTDTYLPSPNGVAVSVHLLQHELTSQGHDVWVVAPRIQGSPGGENLLQVRSVAVPIEAIGRVALPFPLRLPNHLDIIHTHTPFTLGILGAHAAKTMSVPHVSTYHTNLDQYAHYLPGASCLQEKWGVVTRLIHLFYKRADAIVVPSRSTMHLLRKYGIDRAMEIVPTGVSTHLLEAAPLPDRTWPTGVRRLLTIGRLGKEKDLVTVLRAVALIAERVRAHLVVVGAGPEDLMLKSITRAHGLDCCVTFVPPVYYSQIRGFYRSAEILLSASGSETQGLAIAEAQSMGLPVVAVGSGGLKETVDHGRTGYTVAPGDFQSLAEHALMILENKQIQEAFSLQARATSSEYAATQMATRLAGLYERLLAARTT